jgi:chromosome segregation ATPase
VEVPEEVSCSLVLTKRSGSLVMGMSGGQCRGLQLTAHCDSISTAGASEYKLNSKVVTYKKYNETLEGFNILVKAKNFLVFQVGTTSVLSSHRADLRDRHQGDVEQVASQSPKDLAKLIDQISG